MAKWLKGCLVCNADLVTTVKDLVAKGMSKNQVWDRLVEDQQEELGEVLYSKNALKLRFKRHTVVRRRYTPAPAPTATQIKPDSKEGGVISTLADEKSKTIQDIKVITEQAATVTAKPAAQPAPAKPVTPAPVSAPVTVPLPNGYVPKFNRQTGDRIEWAGWSWNPFYYRVVPASSPAPSP